MHRTDITTKAYPPFRLAYESINGSENKYLYNGKEFKSKMDPGWLDYVWYIFDPQIEKWHA